jgi:hypothetical protein
MEKINDKKKFFLSPRFLIIFLLSFFVGYYAKNLAKDYSVVGFEDDQIKVAHSDYSSAYLKEKIKKLQEEQENAAKEEAMEKAKEEPMEGMQGEVEAGEIDSGENN